MRHMYGIQKLSRHGQHRRAMLNNLATALFTHERIRTLENKAKALRPVAENLIRLAKQGDLHARRLAARQIHDDAILSKLFGELAERFRTRDGGFTRVLHLGRRRGDQAMLSMIELVDYKPAVPGAEPAKAEPTKAKAPAKAKSSDADEKAEAPAKSKAPKKAKAKSDEGDAGDDEAPKKGKAKAAKAKKSK